ncbi:MAG: hypothetical protein ACI82Q_003050, partial [Nonlabens sp.]
KTVTSSGKTIQATTSALNNIFLYLNNHWLGKVKLQKHFSISLTDLTKTDDYL